MSKRRYAVKNMSFELPALISDGLDKAATKYNVCKSDIVRSVVYDFLVSSGVLPDNESLNRPEDVNVDGRQSTLLTVE